MLDSEAVLPGYCIFRRDRDIGRGGQVAIIVHKKFNCVEVDCAQGIENVWCEIRFDTREIFIGGIY